MGRVVIANRQVCGVDALPLTGAAPQTFRWIEDE
jgi:hypothetical protein